MSAPRRLPSITVMSSMTLMTIVALVPWLRHREFLRDFFDYGLVWKAIGRIAAGERPYTDFTTPIQAGFLALNAAIDRCTGGTYAGLTLGGAALIVVACVVLPLLLLRRWPAWAAVGVGFSVVASTASHHTILWHNALGVIALAVVAWGAAIEPLWRRGTWSVHALVGAGLFLGGINKLNFQLLALAIAAAWAIHAGLAGRGRTGEVGRTLAALVLAGVVLPVSAELAWTGASLARWWENVATLAAASRAEHLRDILTPRFLLHPLHDYYGAVLLPQAGLVGLVLAIGVIGGCWTAESAGGPRGRRLIVLVAGLGAAAGGAMLLATNFDIVCVGIGACLALVVSVWLGLGAARGPWFLGGLAAPALVIGVTSWFTAWAGLRSQFGFSDAPRSTYVRVETAAPELAALTGLKLPPDVADSLTRLVRDLPPADADGRRPVFFGPGLEFLDRHFPMVRTPREPLWAHWDTSYDAATIERLRAALESNDEYQAVYVLLAFDHWPPAVRQVLETLYAKELVGPRVRRWKFRGAGVELASRFETLGLLGGNVDSGRWHFGGNALEVRALADGRLVLGTARPAGGVLLRAGTNRLRGRAIVGRAAGAVGPIHVDFKVLVHGAIPEESLWQGSVELPADRPVAETTFEVDPHGREVELWVRRDPRQPRALAGYREVEITNAVEIEGDAPALRPASLPLTPADPAVATAFFGAVSWRPAQFVVRGGQAGSGGLEVAAGGEVWLHTPQMTGQLVGEARLVAGPGAVVRIAWYKGGRLQPTQQAWVVPGQPLEFKVWTAEPGGWMGVVVEPGAAEAKIQLRVRESTMQP